MAQELDPTVLQQLQKAVSNVGYVSHYNDEKLPECLLIEFCDVQLFFPPLNFGECPSSQLAFKLIQPSKIQFFTQGEFHPNWPQALLSDEEEPLTISGGAFIVSQDLALPAFLTDQTITHEVFAGEEEPTVQLAFLTEKFGLRVLAKKLEFLSLFGKVEAEEFPKLNARWWDYRDEYWRVRDTDEAMPEDFACELTPTE